MNLVRAIRANKSINRIVRKLIRRFSGGSSLFRNFSTSRWPPTGVLDLSFQDQSFKFYSNCDDPFATIFYYGLQFSEKSDLSLFLQLAKKANTIIDIGANTGVFSVLTALANPQASIYAFEPYDSNAQRLKLNLALNGIKNVTVIQKAVGDSDGEIKLAVPGDGRISEVSSVNQQFSKVIYPEINWATQIVHTQTLDSFAQECNLEIDLIKCDVETFEMSVFKGAKDLLRIQKPTILFECFLDQERQIFFNNLIAEYNYYVYLMLEEGLVYSREGMTPTAGLNYLLTTVKPVSSFINYKNTERLNRELLKNKATSIYHS